METDKKAKIAQVVGMTPEDRAAILKVQANLLKIKMTGRAPINLAQYQELGLVTVFHKNVTGPSGRVEQVLDRLVLTDKGRMILAANTSHMTRDNPR